MSASKTYKSGKEARERLPGDAMKGLQKALAGTQVRVHDRMLALGRGMTPRATGAMRAAWRGVPSNPQSAADAMKPSKVVNTAPQAAIVNAGRRRNKKAYKVRRKTGTVYRVAPGGRVIGSAALPLGVSGPVLKTIQGEIPAILQQEIAKAGGDE